MVTSQLNENPENTHQAVLFHLKRRNEMTVSDLCDLLGITSMAVRRHLVGLQKEGLVDCRLERQSRGRPTHKYRLTAKAESLFPSALNNLAFELLDAVFEARGHAGVMDLLKLRHEALLRKYSPQVIKLSLGERVAQVCKIFSDNGYMTDWSQLPDGNFLIYQQHCAVHTLASQYRQICGLETQLIEQLLGVKVSRQQYILNNDPVCGYLVRPEDLITVESIEAAAGE